MAESLQVSLEEKLMSLAPPRAHEDLVRHTMVDFNQMKTFSKDPLILTQGSGIRVSDSHGRSYIDGISGVFSVSLGHSATPVIEAMISQLRTLAFASPIMSTNDRALELVGELIDLTGGRMQNVKLFSSGSEATEAAMKLARQYHRQTGSAQRYKIVSLYKSYHGATLGALSATGWPKLKQAYEPLAPGFVHAQPPTCYSCPLSQTYPSCNIACARELRQVIEQEGPETIAAIILEPVMLTAGVHVPPREFHQAVRELCDEFGILLIFDELVTGFGRLGTWFAADYFGVWPDLMCVGKGISGGYAPLSGVLMTERVGDAFWGEPDENRQFQAGHTHASNPVSAAAGVATIREMRDKDVLANVERSGKLLARRLEALCDEYMFIAQVRGAGLLYGLEFARDRAAKQPFPNSIPFATAVQRHARQRGLLMRASPQIASLAPPLISTEDEIEEIVGILGQAVQEVSVLVETTGGVDVEVGFGL